MGGFATRITAYLPSWKLSPDRGFALGRQNRFSEKQESWPVLQSLNSAPALIEIARKDAEHCLADLEMSVTRLHASSRTEVKGVLHELTQTLNLIRERGIDTKQVVAVPKRFCRRSRCSPAARAETTTEVFSRISHQFHALALKIASLRDADPQEASAFECARRYAEHAADIAKGQSNRPAERRKRRKKLDKL